MARIASLLLLAVGIGCVFGCGKADPPTKPAAPPDGVTEPTSAQQKSPATEPTPPPTGTQPPPKPPAESPAAVRGRVTHTGKPGQQLSVGYVELTGQDWLGEGLGLPLPKENHLDMQAESGTRPRVAVLAFEKGVVRYEFPHLPPGQYLLSARLADGPTTWATVEVKPGVEITHDFKLESGKGGSVEVTTPADFTGDVRLAPNALIPADDTNFIGGRIAAHLELGAKAKGGKATIPDVPPGKYTLFVIPGSAAPRGTVEVTAGKTATAEVQAEKK